MWFTAVWRESTLPGELVPTPDLPKDRVEFGLANVIGECIVNQPGAFWRREIMQQVGWLDERLTYSLDYDYWIRMALAGARFTRLDPVVACFPPVAKARKPLPRPLPGG